MKNRILALVLLLITTGGIARQADNGDGTYTNPPLYSDFPDPDIIRVGEDFYFVSTTFANTPGVTLLHSKDLVSWEYVSHVAERLDGREQYDLINGTAYRSGLFAASLRHHNGTFYVVVTPVGQNTRIYSSKSAEGPWGYVELKTSAFDPGFFIDDDGTGYIATSGGWDGTLTIITLNEDYTKVVDSKKVYYNRGAEGSKIVKRGEWYYLFNSIPSQLALTVSRAKSLFGPWETKPQISDRTGGHQGALVDLPDGSFYGFVMKDYKSIGRMTNISPVFWQDDWPVWGTPQAPGRVPDVAEKPIKGKSALKLSTSDDFSSQRLGLQWQWNHNPEVGKWSLTERKGFMRLKATKSKSFWTARNTLTQKGFGPWCRGEVRMDLSGLRSGDVCGFGTLGKYNGHIAVSRSEKGGFELAMNLLEDTTEGIKEEVRASSVSFEGNQIYLRTEMNFAEDKAICSYSTDGNRWKSLGGEFPMAYDWRTGTFQGQQFAIFCYNAQPEGGFVDVDSFTFTDVKEEAAETQVVSFDEFEYRGIEESSTALKAGQYRNPIIAGFHPDPSICKVGKDYYLINSTFEYFPGIPVFHSTDLVNWEQIGNVIHRPEQLDFNGKRVCNGLFAPAISYHDGLFYVACTMVDGFGNFVITAENPAGPWSDPIKVNFQGIDPSIFFDADGRAWIVNNDAPQGPAQYGGHRAIWIQEFDYKAMKMVGPRTMIVDGGIDISQKPVWIEGPHVYKRGDWYYLCCAEGGTSTNHSQVILRSEKIEGPYKPWDKNPILTQRNLNGNVKDAVTSTGHADLVIGPDGSWWSVFLAVRPYARGLSPMGRETFMLPVSWTDDGWPMILPSGERVPLVEDAPAGAVLREQANQLNGSFNWSDSFTDKQLNPEWIMLREPQEEWWSVNPQAGMLEISPLAEPLSGSGNPSFLARRVRNNIFSSKLTLEIPEAEGVSAGLALLMTEKDYFYFAVNAGSIYVERSQGGNSSCVASANLDGAGNIELVMDFKQDKCSFSYSQNGGEAKTLIEDVDSTNISWTVQDGMFVGATVGPYARLEEKQISKAVKYPFEFELKGNPIFTEAWTADPATLVLGDTLYVYVGHDDAHGNQMFNIIEWLCYSTKDMNTWTAHGPVMKPTDYKWATGEAWASQVVEKDGKFYFYTTVQHGEPHVGKSIGVAVSDSPTGPFVDARGTALVTDDTTPSDRPWNDIDPTVLIDDDGQAYMAWGNPYLYFVKLKDNMIELDGEIKRIELSHYVEGPWLHKHGETYYLTYPAFAGQRGSEQICYATAPKITGPWTYQGMLTGSAKNSFTIHPAIVEFKGQSYLFYHNATLTLNGEDGTLGRRSACAEYLYYNPDGTIKPIEQTEQGISVPAKAQKVQVPDTVDENFYVFLCLGQSNMDGAGAIEPQDRKADERFVMLSALDMPVLGRETGSWYEAVAPLCRENGGIGPADWFGRTLANKLPADVKVGVVNVAVPGCRIELFDKDGCKEYAATAPDWMTNFIDQYGDDPYKRLVDMAKIAQKSGVIKGIILHQGESNTGDKDWPAKVKLVYENLLSDLNLDAKDVPLLAGETVNATEKGVCAGMNEIIATLPDTIATAHVVSSADCSAKGDHLHFDSAGNRELGRRYAEKMLGLLGE